MTDSPAINDLGARRKLSDATLKLYNVSVNGNGWFWETKTMSGGVATRWKSFYSNREDAPEIDRENWQKYRWHPSKPEDAKYFYPPSKSLGAAIKDALETLWLVGGEIAAMSMLEAGWDNTTCFFGDNAIPDTLVDDLKSWGVKLLKLIPDRDEAGLGWACKVRDALLGAGIEMEAYKLPYEFEKSHGKDVNDLWIESPDTDTFTARLGALERWTLPEPNPIPTGSVDISAFRDSDLPGRFLEDAARALGATGEYRPDGWAKKPVTCPFHNDEHPSAYWNRTKGILHCFSGCGKTYLAKEVGERFNLSLKDYYETAPERDKQRDTPIVKVDSPAAPEPPKTNPTAPALSAFAQLTAAQRIEARQGRKWLDEFISWATEAAPLSPNIFFEALGLWILALAATRRVKVVLGGENIFPNLYIFLIATTTVYRKSTALNLANQVIERAGLDFLKMPERATPEALFEYLAGRPPANYRDMSKDEQRYWSLGRTFAAQRGIMEDEASGLLSEMRKDYMAGLSELLLKGYDGQGTLRKLLKAQGLITVKEMCLSFFGATTPVEWGRRISNEERQNGFIARFAIVTPECAPVWRETADEVILPGSITERLRHMFFNTLPWDKALLDDSGKPHGRKMEDDVEPPECRTMSIDPAALEQIKKYRKALSYDMLATTGGDVPEDKAASYARLGTMMVKVGMLLASIDGSLRIEPRHAYAAQQVCEGWRESLHRLDDHVADTRNERLDDKLLHCIKSAGSAGITLRDIKRILHIDVSRTRELETQLKDLQDAGTIETFLRDNGGRGRKPMCYRLVVQDDQNGS